MNYKGKFAHTEGLFKKDFIIKLSDLKNLEICKFIYLRVPNKSAYQPKSAKVSFFKGSAKMSAKVGQIELESA